MDFFKQINIFFSSRRRHTRYGRDWSSDVCSSDLPTQPDPSRTALRIVDIRDRTAVPTGQNWLPNVYEDPSWTAANIGQVVGVTIDTAGAIYTTATTVYGDFRTGCGTGTQPAGAFGSLPGAGPGSVYRVNPITGVASLFTNLPNSGAGLGNVAYDS